jgi:hypothetical protein
MCAECKGRIPFKQRRTYADDTVSSGSVSLNYNPFGGGGQDQSDSTIAPPPESEATPERNRTTSNPWGLKTSTDTSTETSRPTRAAWGLTETSKTSPELDSTDEVDPETAAEAQQARLWEQFERTDAELLHEEDAPSSAEVEADTSASAESARAEYRRYRDAATDIDYTAEFQYGVQARNPDIIARCLFVADRKDDLAFIRSIPPDTFSECIRILQPSNVIEPLATAHVELSEAMTKALGVSSMGQVAWEYGSMLRQMLTIRQSVGIQLSLDDYSLVLRAAKDLGDLRLASWIWGQLHNNGLTPNTTCYNHYMAATIWNGVHRADVRHQVRVIPFHMMARKAGNLGKAFWNYRVSEGGVKQRVMSMFGIMLSNNAIANEESFRHVITAAAREGDLNIVKSVLKKIWNVDIDALQSGQTDDSANTPKAMEKSSPLYPTTHLLFIVAHAFSINNDVPTALRTVDFVARHFDLEIDLRTWQQLFEWTFVLATPRTGLKSRHDGTRQGQLPLQSVFSLWETMTNEPYNVQPTMGMYNYLVRNLQHRDMLGLMAEKIFEGMKLSRKELDAKRRAWDLLCSAVARKTWAKAYDTSEDPATPTTGSILELRRSFEHKELLHRRNTWWLQRWIRLFLSLSGNRVKVDVDGDWSLRAIPALLWRWKRFAPPNIRYESDGGWVEFDLFSEAERQQRREDMAEAMQLQASVLEEAPLGFGEWWLRQRSFEERTQEAAEADQKRRYGKWE